MKNYDQLNDDQKQNALDQSLTRLLESIISGVMRFNDELNGDRLQARIDAALTKADEMLTPWFAHEYVMDVAKDELTALARADIQDARYSEQDEIIMHGIA